MTKQRSTSPTAAGFDALRRSLAWTGEALARVAGSGIDAAVHALGLVSEEDLRGVDQSLARLERRLARLEARQRERMAAAARVLDEVAAADDAATSPREDG